MAGEKSVHELDVTGLPCPQPFARIKLELEMMEPGDELQALVDKTSLANVPKSLKEEGHKILSMQQLEGGRFRLIIRRGED